MTPPLPTRDDIARKHILAAFDEREGLTTRPDMMQLASERDDFRPVRDFAHGLGSACAVYLIVALFVFAWVAL